MYFLNFFTLVALLVFNNFSDIDARRGLVKPLYRGGTTNKDFPTPKNGESDENNCGGLRDQHWKHEGKCGVCGDSYGSPRPRPHENGGNYGRGDVTETYKAGSNISVEVESNVKDLGFFEFALCPLKNRTELETEECFDEHEIKLVNGGNKYFIENSKSDYFRIELRLPAGLICERCVLRWQYIAGFKWNCPDPILDPSCELQDTFRTCSDVKIQ